MTIEEVGSLLHASAFALFTTHTAGGKTFAVPHSDTIPLPAAGRTAIEFLFATQRDVHGPAPSKT